MKKLTTILIFILINTICFGQIIHVPADYPNIQSGINAANNGDTVLVEQGTYFENINFLGKAITVASQYIIESDSANIYNTIINGSQASNPDSASVVLFISGEDSTSVLYGFTIMGGTGLKFPEQTGFEEIRGGGGIAIENSGAKICHNLITNNSVENEEEAFGGGIAGGLCMEDKWVVVEHNLIKNNTAISNLWPKGGGMAIAYCNSRICNNTVVHNTVSANSSTKIAAAGGVWYSCDVGFQDSVIISGNIIQYNLVEQFSANSDGTAGAGLCMFGAYGQTTRALVKNNVISDNELHAVSVVLGCGATLVNCHSVDFLQNKIYNNTFDADICFGGGLCIWNNHPLVSRNLIYGNMASRGGGIYVGHQITSEPQFFNNTIYGNEAVELGGGLYLRNAACTIANEIMWNNTAPGSPGIFIYGSSTVEVNYSLVEDWIGPGNGNLDEDPLLVDPENGNFHLSVDSPCIDSGNPSSDPDPDGTNCDMGKFYYNQGTLKEVPADFATIQQGINASNNGDTVLVEQGTYSENINFMGKAIFVASHYIFESDSAHIYNTIIDGSQPTDPDIGSVVTFNSNTDTTSCLLGFTITGGTGTRTPFFFPLKVGGGINFNMAGGKLVSNIIKNNECILDTLDGGVYGGAIGSGPHGTDHLIIIRENIIRDNLVWTKGPNSGWNYGWAEGGAMQLGFNAIVERNLITSNSCKSTHGISAGGAIRICADPPAGLYQTLVVVKNNQISNNESTSETYGAFAGGISCSAGNTIIENNKIINNSVESQNYCRGAGLYFDLINTYYARVNNNIISNNCSITGSSIGGAIGLYQSIDIEICNNLILNNSADNGGAFSINTSLPRLISNNTIIDNTASQEGGSFYIYEDSEVEVLNSILRNNIANGIPDEIYVQNGCTFSIQYSNIEGYWSGTGNIDGNPLFVGNGDYPYSLLDDSPCVNTGIIDTTGLSLPELDLAGNQRLFGGRIEMGAYENQNVITEIKKINNIEIPIQCYPNPIKQKATLEFNLQHPEFVSLTIHNTLGQEITNLIWEKLDAGTHKIKWNTADLENGFYLLQLNTREFSETKKVLLMR